MNGCKFDPSMRSLSRIMGSRKKVCNKLMTRITRFQYLFMGSENAGVLGYSSEEGQLRRT